MDTPSLSPAAAQLAFNQAMARRIIARTDLHDATTARTLASEAAVPAADLAVVSARAAYEVAAEAATCARIALYLDGTY